MADHIMRSSPSSGQYLCVLVANAIQTAILRELFMRGSIYHYFTSVQEVQLTIRQLMRVCTFGSSHGQSY